MSAAPQAERVQRGIKIVNDEGLPPVIVERLAIVNGHQVYRVKTDKGFVDLRVTPKGFLRVDHPQ